MIRQIANLKTKTGPLPSAPNRKIQAQMKKEAARNALPTTGFLRNPMTGMSYVVPITRWIE
jgi:hypothetical protein